MEDEEEAPEDNGIDNRPFIPNDDPQYINRLFSSNEGIDFYIDAARFLPDNVSATKVVI